MTGPEAPAGPARHQQRGGDGRRLTGVVWRAFSALVVLAGTGVLVGTRAADGVTHLSAERSHHTVVQGEQAEALAACITRAVNRAVPPGAKVAPATDLLADAGPRQAELDAALAQALAARGTLVARSQAAYVVGVVTGHGQGSCSKSAVAATRRRAG